MKIHLRNVIGAALEKGVVLGFHRANKTASGAPQIDGDAEAFCNTMMKTIWECLDPMVDFTDEDTSDDDVAKIGFEPTDARGSILSGYEFTDDE